MPQAIPGFDEASAQEQWERNAAHLNLPEEVCGARLRQITPLDLCRLHAAKSPFLMGGVIGHEHIAQFIFLLWHESNPPILYKRWGFLFSRAVTMEDAVELATNLPIEQWQDAIDEFLEVTFRDNPTGGKHTRDAPIAASASWSLYRMGCEPFRWDIERTYHTPIRVTNQLIRCWQDENGSPVINRLSGAVMAEWLTSMDAKMKSGEWVLSANGYPMRNPDFKKEVDCG